MEHRVRDLLDGVPVINYITIIRPTVGYRWRDSGLMVSVYISQHPSTSPSNASRLQQPPHGAIYVQQCRQPRRLVLQDKAIWTSKKLCIFRASSMEFTCTDSS